MEQIKIDRLIRSRRKTVALIINPDATLTVRAPIRLALHAIEKLVNKKIPWIRKTINYIQSKPKVKSKEFVDGEEFLYLGKTFRLKIVDDKEISLGEYLNFPKSMLYNPQISLIEWYKNKAKHKIEEQVSWYAHKMSVKYKSISIRDPKKRLGSCSSKGSLNFSWRLILSPIHVIDYVVVHELTHLQEHNHSQQFWQKVKLHYPEYQQANEWIRNNGHLLTQILQ